MAACIRNCVQLLETEIKNYSDLNTIKCIFLSRRSLAVGSPRTICIATDIKDTVSLLLSASLPLVPVFSFCSRSPPGPSRFLEHHPSNSYSKQEIEEKGTADKSWHQLSLSFVFEFNRHETLTCLHFTGQKYVNDAF